MQVGRLTEAIRAGDPIPPMVVDRESLRIVDGFHRYHAYKRLKTAEIEVNLEKYPSEAALFLRAVMLNARHGVPLSPQDQGRVFLLAEKLEITRENLADALAIRVSKLGNIERKFGKVHRAGLMYLKPALRHFAGGPVPKEVAEIADGVGGNTGDFYIRQLLMLIRSGGLKMNDATAALLSELAEAIEGLTAVTK
jgi:hypothetical protein